MCAAAGVVVGDLGVMLFGGEEEVRTVTPSTRCIANKIVSVYMVTVCMCPCRVGVYGLFMWVFCCSAIQTVGVRF